MRFIGCKENLLGFIESFLASKNITGGVFFDMCSGTGKVAKHFKKLGYSVVSSDLLYFSYVLQKTYIELNDYPDFDRVMAAENIKPHGGALLTDSNDARAKAYDVIRHLNALDGVKGFVYSNYSPEGTKKAAHQRRYFTEDNAKKIDAIRMTLAQWRDAALIDDDGFYFLLAALVEAVPFVSNISGTYAAFLKNWDKRAHKALQLQTPALIKSEKRHRAYHGNGLDLLGDVKDIDILYIDPPYNERQYAPNYHILETIARGDNPPIRGVTGMRPYESQKSAFCNRAQGLQTLSTIIGSGNYKNFLLSYSSDGIMPESRILHLLEEKGKAEVAQVKYQRYKSNSNGAQKSDVTEKLYYLKKRNPLNRLNDLSGAEWLFFLNSVEVTNYSTRGADGFAHHLRKQHPSPKPPQLLKKFVDFFSKAGGTVFDPFMGAGSTLLACSLAGRKGIGIDLSEEYVALYKQVCDELKLKQQTALVGDSADLDKLLLRRRPSFDFILTDPPYGEMLSKKRTGERQKKNGVAVATPFTSLETDLGNMPREDFLHSLKCVMEKSARFLKPRGYIAIFVKDMQPAGKEHNMLHALITEKILEIENISFRGYKIWYDATQKLYPFGYPHAFVANQFHQYIMIFRKEK